MTQRTDPIRTALEPGDVDERLEALNALRTSPRLARLIDQALIAELDRRAKKIEEARRALSELESAVDALTAPPLTPARVISVGGEAGRTLCRVSDGSSVSVVTVAPEVDVAKLHVGESVLLGPKRNVVVALDSVAPNDGSVATITEVLEEGAVMVAFRSEQYKARLAKPLAAANHSGELGEGSRVLWSQHDGLVLEHIPERDHASRYEVVNPPRTGFSEVGGLGHIVEELRRSFALMASPNVAARYGVRKIAKSVMLVGPPGNGKTLMARALAHELAAMTGTGAPRFLVVKPGELLDEYFGVSGRNIRNLFAHARKLAATGDGPVVLFFDEIDGWAPRRGRSFSGADDRVATSLLTELDGFDRADGDNLFVISATNRASALDRAARREGRLADIVLEVPRPDRAAAREIFDVHLPEELDLAEGLCRETLLSAATSRIYSPNGAGPLARLHLRDGGSREVGGPQMVSGAMIANATDLACRAAALREIESGERGLLLDDLLGAIDEGLRSAAGMLAPWNVHHDLPDLLPQDTQVVRVELLESAAAAELTHLAAV